MKNIFKTTLMVLCGAAVMASCSDDRDSNPVLNTNGDVTFRLNAPAIGSSVLDLSRSTGLELTWSQPVLTEDNAPLGQAGVYGVSYVAQLSKDGNFTKSFTEALAEVTDENGDYMGTPTGQDYTELTTKYSSCASAISATELNTAFNELNVWSDEASVPESASAYIRIVCRLYKTNGTTVTLATSNTQPINATGITWTDVTAQPVEISYLWVPGAGNGWSHDVAPILTSDEETGNIYTGYAYLNGEFKFTTTADWQGTEYNNGSFTSTTENIDCGDGAGGNINCTGEAGMYWLEVNVKTGELLATPVKWGVVGGFNSWSVADGEIIDMTFDETNHCLKCTPTFDTDTKWKFARDNAWDYNFGGSLDALVAGGDDITATAGTHTIKLYIERPSVDGYHATIE
jgi:starch-binding outer membrane protein SusE/F